MFASTVSLFDAYYGKLDAMQRAGFNRDLGCEVRERLEQLNYIITRVRQLEQLATAVQGRSQAVFRAHIEEVKTRGALFETESVPSAARVTREEFKTMETVEFEMKLLAETFYYVAGRVRTILRNVQAPLPGLTNFECDGVRNTRNKLLEHAEGKGSRVSIQSFGWGGSQGPVIKALRYGGQEHVFPDRGLYENAEEFRVNLEHHLQSAVAGA